MAAGLLCLAAALGLTGYNLWDARRAEEAAAAALEGLQAAMPAREETPAAHPLPPVTEPPGEVPGETPGELLGEPPTLTVDGQTYLGILSIPALELETPILSRWSYPQLRLSPCRFQGWAGADGFILVGHNYRRHFGRLAELRPGDEVVFTDVAGGQYRYAVSALEALSGDDLEALTGGGWPLTLVTCTWGGRGRVAARCTRQAP